MDVVTKTTNAGPVGFLPTGDYNGTKEYRYLLSAMYNRDTWLCIVLGPNGSPFKEDGTWYTVKGETPGTGLNWVKITDGGLAAYNEGETAKQKGNTAQQQGNAADQKGNAAEQKGNTAAEKAALANEKAAYAQQQGDYAKTQAERAEAVADQVVEEVLENFVFATPAECRSIVTEYRSGDMSV